VAVDGTIPLGGLLMAASFPRVKPAVGAVINNATRKRTVSVLFTTGS
jgi:hypothetical protein